MGGWGGFVLKEKFKLIKGSRGEWHKNADQQIQVSIERLQHLDLNCDNSLLEDFEVEVRLTL